MSRRQRCDSKWNKIIVIDENNQYIEKFELNELGQLKNKLKTQKRRKIHEGRRTKKIEDPSKASIPKVNDEESNQNLTFDFDVFNDQDNSMFDNFQDFSGFDNEINYDINKNESIFLNDTEIIPDFYNDIISGFDL